MRKSYCFILCALAFVMADGRAVRAQTIVPPRYELGEVPDQTVWSGSSRSFLVYSAGGAGAALALTASPQPQGVLTLEPHLESDWLFRYLPAPADSSSFNVTISGGGQSQSFVIAPQPSLPPEASVFQTDQHTQPLISTHEVSVFDQASVLRENLNYQNRIVHHVRIVGETVELQEDHENGLYEAYANGDRGDIKSMDIIAERVIVRSPVRLKQTAVTIWARELVFEGEGLIQTTPEERLQAAGAGAAGVDGLPAGPVTLNIGTLLSDTAGLNFDLSGGRGQPGGPGQHGSPGSSVTSLGTSKRVCDSGICKTHNAASGARITYWYYTFTGITVAEGGTKTRPGDGTHAKPSGQPGEGGAGGTLKSTIDVSGAFANSGGASAAPTFPPKAPYDKFQGGAAGSPNKSEHVHFYLNFFSMLSSASTHTSKKGNDAVLRRATTASGPAGAYNLEESNWTWIHPLALRKILNHVQNDYLANNIEGARARLADYAALLTEFRTSPAWASIEAAAQLELVQMHDEIRTLLQRVEGGLDYFGNPAGWVPMLSFEVTKNAFETEIDRAIQTLYLTYWLGSKAQTEQHRLAALSAARDQLRDELEKARTDYDDAMQRLPALSTAAANLRSRIQTTQNRLEAEEIKLLQDTREESWVTGLRLGLKLSAMMCQMIPVYQPALGAVGEGIRVASDFDPKRPWDTIKSLPNIAAAYSDSPFAQAAAEQMTAKDNIDPNEAEEKGFDYAAALQQSAQGLMTGVDDIRQFIEERKAPSAEMLAELERLKSRSPEYKALLEEVEALMEENRKFSEEILVTMQRIATLSGVMRRNLLAIDALNRDIAPGEVVLDDRATAYLGDMERRAYDRLLKYHYYMAKAYEYRLLKPYGRALNLEGLVKKFEEIAKLDSHTISAAEFASLKQVYSDLVAEVAQSIYDQFISNRPDLSVPIRFNLTQEQLAILNAGGTVPINLHELGFFPLSQENIRIVDLKVFSIATEVEGGGSYGSTAFVDFRMAHSGLSNLKRDGKVFLFRHYNQNTENPIVWGGRYDPVDSQIDPIEPSDASDSLLRSLLSGPATSDMLLYSRPSAWADLLLSRTYFDNSGRKILLTSVRLEMVYDFTPRNESLGLRTLEVAAAGVEPGGDEPQILAPEILPFFELDKVDANNRRNARGQFTRVYPGAAGTIELSAPETYGQWEFYQWADRFGRPLSGGTLTSPTIMLNAQEDTSVMAQYVLATPATLRVESPVLSGGNLLLRWTGGAGTHLQTAPRVNGTWQDVPGSEGQSQTSIPIAPGAAYFRAIRR
jgi:predicted  nucleic acid-binding Zn-ribbon protein